MSKSAPGYFNKLGLTLDVKEDENTENVEKIFSCPKGTFNIINSNYKKMGESADINKKYGQLIKKYYKNGNICSPNCEQIKPLIRNLLEKENPISNHKKDIKLNIPTDNANDRIFNVYVYKHTPNNETKPKIYKIFYYPNEPNNTCTKYIDYEAIKEIVFTKKAKEIMDNYNKTAGQKSLPIVKIPEIYNYGVFDIDENEPMPLEPPKGDINLYNNKPRRVIFIEMEFLEIPVLRDALKDMLFDETDWENKSSEILHPKFNNLKEQMKNINMGEQIPEFDRTLFNPSKLENVLTLLSNIKNAFEILMKNNIYNNDETIFNIMYDIKTNTIGIIDFGEATAIAFSGHSDSGLAKYEFNPNYFIRAFMRSIMEKGNAKKNIIKTAWEETPSPKASAQAFGKNNFTINTNGSSEDENAVSINDHAAFEENNKPKKSELSGWFGGKKTKQNKKRCKTRRKTRRKTRFTRM